MCVVWTVYWHGDIRDNSTRAHGVCWCVSCTCKVVQWVWRNVLTHTGLRGVGHRGAECARGCGHGASWGRHGAL